MAIPTLSDEDRAAALAKGVEVRKARADLKARLKNRELSVNDVLDKAAADEVIAKTKVIDLLRSLPGIGAVKAKALMAELDIAANRRIGGLGAKQITRLKTALDH